MKPKNYDCYTILDENEDSIGSVEYHFGLAPNSEIIENYFLYKQKISEEQLLEMYMEIQDRPVNIIMNMYVEPEFRKQGYGNELVEYVINNNRGVTFLIADVHETSFIIKFYEAFGFKILCYLTGGFPLMVFEPL